MSEPRAPTIVMRDGPAARPFFEVEGWSASGVRAVQTTRGLDAATAGAAAAREAFNLARHVGDDSQSVEARRDVLRRALGVERIVWLEQVHGTGVHVALETGFAPGDPRVTAAPCADAVITSRPDVACAVMTADCLPVLFASRDGVVVGAIHAGWRGLAAGVIEAALTTARSLWATGAGALAAGSPSDAAFDAWVGPAIGLAAFEVGPEVREALIDADRRSAASRRANDDASTPASVPRNVEMAFRRGEGDRWHADLAALAWRRLAREGAAVSLSGLCTFDDAARWYSHRRDSMSGRQASLIWRAA